MALLWPLGALGSEQTPRWGYEGDDGPEHWGDITQEFDMCRRGKNQSPTDPVAFVDAPMPELIFEYQPQGVNPGDQYLI